jgi:hypothetical protein
MAISQLHWSEEEFWSSTPHAFYAACEEGRRQADERERGQREKEFEDWLGEEFGLEALT